MGNVCESVCVSLKNSQQFTTPLYTVKRTSGIEDSGWSISKPCIGAGQPSWIDMHACKYVNSSGWRIFMHNNLEDPNEYAFGWRRVETINPSHLNGNPDAIHTWRESLIQHLDTLEMARLAALPP